GVPWAGGDEPRPYSLSGEVHPRPTHVSVDEFSLQLVVRKHFTLAHYPPRGLLEAQHFPYGRGRKHVQVCTAAGVQAVILKPEGACRVVGYSFRMEQSRLRNEADYASWGYVPHSIKRMG
ncbi:MAG TPA: hypothetical protein VIY29_25155, partial [Ktedonobacteraceae bacterium]